MAKILVFAVMFVLTLQTPARATELGLDLSKGAQTNSQELTASGDFSSASSKSATKDSDDVWGWDLSYTHSTQQSDTTSGSVKDETHDVSPGLTWDYGGFNAGLNYDYSTTPDENLTSSGPSVSLGYKFLLGSKGSDDEDEDVSRFIPALTAQVTLGQENYRQTFAATKPARRRNAPARPINGDNTIGQKYAGGTLKLKPWSWVYLKVGYKKYSYNKNVQDFLQYLDNQQALGAPTQGFSSALSGFYDHSISAQLHFDFLGTWSLDLKHAVSTIALDNSQTTDDKIVLSDDLTEKWNLGVGAERFHSGSSGESDTATLLSLAYSF